MDEQMDGISMAVERCSR